MTLRTISKGLSKGLYTEEGDMNDWEYKVINAVAALGNVLFWHRNPERGVGFGIMRLYQPLSRFHRAAQKRHDGSR